MAIGVMPPAKGGTFSNATPIMIPASGTEAESGAPADPYPSVISVTGIPGNEVISGLTVTLVDFSHQFPDDVDILLIGPNGVRVLLMSDAGVFFDLTDADLTFNDSGDPLPDNAAITEGTYRPTNYGEFDVFPSPAPGGPYGALLAVFNDLQPNGEWGLYIVDDAEFDTWAVAGGWTLDITTFATTCGNNVLEPTEECDDGDVEAGDGCGPTCLFEVCGNGYVDPGEDCDDGNTVSEDGCSGACVAEFCGDSEVQEGLGETCDDGNTTAGDGCGPVCLFEECGNSFVDPGEDCDDGNTVGCDGCHTCDFTGPPFCNQASITIPAPPGTFSPAPSDPYPSTISVFGIPDGHVVSGLTVTLKGFSHTNPDDVDMLLVGPGGGGAVAGGGGLAIMLMSDAGGSADVADVDVTFADGAGQLPDNTQIFAGTYRPTKHGTPDQIPAPAPQGPYITGTLSEFIGLNPRGIWALYVSDDVANFQTGTFASGWTLNVVTAFAQCGNGILEPGEGCDDGNAVGGDGCSAVCDPEVCGNGIVDPGEGCDDANSLPCDGCDNCQLEAPPVCGNGVTECFEDCDDTNTNQTDGCLADCTQGAAVPASPPGCPSVTITSHSSTDTPISISAVGTPTITSTIAVADAGTYVLDINVETLLPHPECEDVDVTLTSPVGTSVTLTTDNGGADEDWYSFVIFDSQADQLSVGGSNLVSDISAADLKFFLAPEESLGAFNGQNPNGNWTLTVSDDSDFDGGDLLGWSLLIATLPQAPNRIVMPTFASAPNLAIGPGIGTVEDTITVSGAGDYLIDISATTDCTHTLSADIDMWLIAPDGTEGTLTTDNAAINDDVFAGTSWYDFADLGNPAPYNTPNPASNLVTDTAYTNLVVETALVPEEPLAVFAGKNPNGTWTIRVRDDATNPFGGTLNSWSLTITTASCGDPPQLCELPSGNENTDDPCFVRQPQDCAGGVTDICQPIEAKFDGNDIFASSCACYLAEADTCGPVGIAGDYIACFAPCFPGECRIFEDHNALNVSELHIDHMSMTAVYTCGCALPGDSDGDEDVDLKDLKSFYECFGRQDVSPGDDCASADLDNDRDVDAADFQVMWNNFAGPR